jgi:hypothetical protein
MNSPSGLINAMAGRLDDHDQVLALCVGAPGEFGEKMRAQAGVYVLSEHELLWRNDFGLNIDIALEDVQRLDTTTISQYSVYCEVVTHGGHVTALGMMTNEYSRGQEFYDALEAAVRASRESRREPDGQPMVSLADELDKLDALRQRGVLTDAEFEMQKRALLDR